MLTGHPTTQKPRKVLWWKMRLLRELYKEMPNKGVLPGDYVDVCNLLEERCHGKQEGNELLAEYLEAGLIVADVPKWKQPGTIPYQINPMYFHRGLLIDVSDLERKEQ